MSKTTRTGRSHVKWIAAGVLLVAGAGGTLVWTTNSPTATTSVTQIAAAKAHEAHVRRETRPTLDPGRFVGKAAVTHQIAREIPDVLDQLYCYCQCDKSIGHKSLLSCYTDGHAAT